MKQSAVSNPPSYGAGLGLTKKGEPQPGSVHPLVNAAFSFNKNGSSGTNQAVAIAGKKSEIEYSDKATKSASVGSLWFRADQAVAAAPTVLLAGMYGAAAFSIFSIGHASIGFLIGAIPVFALAVVACLGRLEEPHD